MVGGGLRVTQGVVAWRKLDHHPAQLTFLRYTVKMEVYSLDGMIRQMMDNANNYYKQKAPIPAVGFIVGQHPEDPSRRRCGVIHADFGIDDTAGLVRFAGTLRGLLPHLDACDAGIMCELNISVDKQPAEPSAVIYVDQKYGGMRVMVAPLTGEDLVFRDFGAAHPTINFFPGLFTAAAYGPAHAEA